MIYEGRGWEVEADRPDEEFGWELKRLKGVSVDIAYIGTYDRTCSQYNHFKLYIIIISMIMNMVNVVLYSFLSYFARYTRENRKF